MNRLLWLALLPVVFSEIYGDGVLNTEDNNQLQADCGKPSVPQHPKRVRRSMQTPVVSRSEAPWVVKVTRSKVWRPNMTMTEKVVNVTSCSGSLISPRHILTAAHCVGDFTATCDPINQTLVGKGSFGKVNLDRFVVRFGEYCNDIPECNRQGSFKERAYSVKRIFVSSAYTGFACTYRRNFSAEGDIAILVLSEDVEYSSLVYPVCVNERQIEPGETITLFGYGTDGIHYDGQLRKQQGKVPEECPRGNRDTICTTDVISSACPGDSGGGTVIYDERETASIVSVISNGEKSCPSFLAEMVKKPSPPMVRTTAVDKHVAWICAATGVCPTDEIREVADKYDMYGYAFSWYIRLDPLVGDNVYL